MTTASSGDPVVQIENITKRYPAAVRTSSALIKRPHPRFIHALDGVDLTINRGQILGLVGESGSGKTTLAMTLMGLIKPTSGRVLFDGQDLHAALRGRGRLAMRRRIQLIFQDPYESLNPRQKIFDILAEPLRVHGLAGTPEALKDRVASALTEVGLHPPETYFDRYPEGLSGGQRQRVSIAAALILDPELLVADEPVSMLDVSMRAEILTLLRELRDRRGLTVLYITHDLATAAFFTDRLAVMYLGRVVESGATTNILTQPQHPYTRALLSVIPVPNPRLRRKREVLQGEIPSAIDLPSGCRFHPRCPDAIDRCRQIDPSLMPTATGQFAACILTGEPLYADE